MNILTENMANLYKASSWGWDEKEKAKELFNKISHFLLLFNESSEIIAFLMFQFTWDDLNDPEVIFKIKIYLI